MDIKLTESTFVRVHEDGVCVDIVHRVLEKGEHILVCMSPEEYQTFLDKTCGAQLTARDNENLRLREGLKEIADAAANGDCYCELGDPKYHAVECPVAIRGRVLKILDEGKE